MKTVKRILVFLLTIVLLGAEVFCAFSEEMAPDNSSAPEEGTGRATTLQVSFSEYVPFGEERMEMLNRLLKHISLRVSQDGNISETEVLSDGEPVFSMTAKEENGERLARFSFDQEHIYRDYDMSGMFGASTIEQGLLSFPIRSDLYLSLDWLDENRLRLMDDGFAFLSRLPELFPDKINWNNERQKLKEVGTSVRKGIITIKKEEAEAGAMDILAESCDNPVMKDFVSQLRFTGRQQFTLFFDESEALIRVQYSGQAGPEGDSRKVTLDWRALRGSRVYDQITFKAPAVSGGNQDNFSLTRDTVGSSELSSEGSARETVVSLTSSAVRNKVKSSLEGSCSIKEGEKNDDTEVEKDDDKDAEKNDDTEVGKDDENVSISLELKYSSGKYKEALKLEGEIPFANPDGANVHENPAGQNLFANPADGKARFVLSHSVNGNVQLEAQITLDTEPGAKLEWLTEDGCKFVTGSEAGRENIPAETGDAAAETGGVPAETGDAAAETGGVPAETGGVPAETGGVHAETGAFPAETMASMLVRALMKLPPEDLLFLTYQLDEASVEQLRQTEEKPVPEGGI